MKLRAGDGRGIDTHPRLRATALVNAASADALFADSGKTATQLFQAAQDGTLGVSTCRARCCWPGAPDRTGGLPQRGRQAGGHDAAAAMDHVVYSAHLDHVGIGAPVKGDAIYNGALDNALGVAIMRKPARDLAAAKAPPKRRCCSWR